uniref:Uncharacterized protein n=1 Tax=Anguilla anguilla TaxID=7936 RepID=A0A0E9U783_ANGAN
MSFQKILSCYNMFNFRPMMLHLCLRYSRFRSYLRCAVTK